MLWRTTRSSPVCLICGAPMAFHGTAGRAANRKTEIWQCPACGGTGASFYAIRPALHVAAPTPAHLFSLSRLTARWAAAAARSAIEREIAEAEQAIKHCRGYGERQRAEVERCERLGEDASRAKNLLATFRRIEAEHKAHRERLLAEMAEGRRMTEGREPIHPAY